MRCQSGDDQYPWPVRHGCTDDLAWLTSAGEMSYGECETVRECAGHDT